MPLKICYENIVKIVCNYHFLKKKKWNGIVAMALPNSIPLFTIQKFFFYPLFWQCHCHNCQKFYTLYFGNAIAANYYFFPPIFGNGIATIAKFFFPSFGFPCAHSHFEHPPRQQVWAEGIAAILLPKIKNFSLLLFIFLSPTFVEFRQWYCRNSLSFLRLLNKLK